MACLRQVQTLLVLSPNLPDLARCDALLQSASLWQALGNSPAATSSVQQVELIAAAPNRLQPAQWRDLWLRVAAAYEALDDLDQASSARQTADRRSSQSDPSTSGPFLPDFFTEPRRSPALEEAIAGRQQRAVTVIEQWIALDGGDVGPEVADLAEFMRREDEARSAAYSSAVDSEPELAVQAAAVWDQVRWLSTKYQAALGGFGISLVPEWEESAPAIRSELTKAYETLYLIYGDMATAMPSKAQADQAWVELLRQEILFGKLGLYPDYPEEPLAERLSEAQDSLSEVQPAGLRLSSSVEDGVRVYFLEGEARQ